MKNWRGEKMTWFDDSNGEKITWVEVRLWIERFIGRHITWRGLHPNFSGKDLTGVTLDVFDLTNCNFDDCIFTHENSDREFYLDFTNSKMRRVDMTGAGFMTTSFFNCDLEGANFSGTFLQGVDFSNANLNGANFVGTDWCSKKDEDGSRWAATLACNADLTGADLTGADLAGVDLSGADLTNAILVNTNLRGANLSNTVFTNADLTGADLTNASLTNSTLQK